MKHGNYLVYVGEMGDCVIYRNIHTGEYQIVNFINGKELIVK